MWIEESWREWHAEEFDVITEQEVELWFLILSSNTVHSTLSLGYFIIIFQIIWSKIDHIMLFKIDLFPPVSSSSIA